MLRAIDLYRRLVAVQIQSQLQYRMAFILETVIGFFILLLFFLSLVLVLERFKSIGGWTLGEIAFLYGLAETGLSMADMIFSGFDGHVFGQRIRRGDFDQLLLRPVSTTLQVFGSKFVIRRLGRILQGVAIFIIALTLTDIQWTALKIIYLPVVLLSMTCFFGGFFMVEATITFWTVQSIEAINVFTYGGGEMMSYPMHIYQDWMRYFFTFIIPAIFLNYYPALFFLDKPDPFDLPSFAPFLAPFAGVGLLAAALKFWQFGLKHYQSTGS